MRLIERHGTTVRWEFACDCGYAGTVSTHAAASFVACPSCGAMYSQRRSASGDLHLGGLMRKGES